MAKVKTKAELEDQILTLQNEIDRRDRKIQLLSEEVQESESAHNSMIQMMIDCLNNYSYRDNKLNMTFVYFRIGELLRIEKEYSELKDRALPIPKMEVMEKERRNINGSQGLGPLN